MPSSTTSVVPAGVSLTDPNASGLTDVHSNGNTPRLKSSSVEFSRTVFAIWWAAISVVHLTALGYHARITVFYWRFPNSPVGEMVELYNLSLPQTYCRAVAMLNATIASVHGLAILRMARNSARAGQLVFYVDENHDVETTGETAVPEGRPRICRLRDKVVGLFAYNGPLGVEGRHFDLLLYTSEFVETLLQTYQAYRVNSLVARRWLSQLYVGVLVFNCWAIPLIYVVHRTRVAHKRLLSLMCDCILDVVSSVVVPGTLFFFYLADFIPETRSLERTRWYDDRWLVQVWSEHNLLVISSWVDGISRLIFGIGLLLSMEGVKQLLRVETVKPQARPVLMKRLSRKFMQLIEPSTTPQDTWTAVTHRRLTPLLRHNTETLVRHLERVRWAAIFHTILALWGLVVVAIHADAEIKHASTPRLSVCPIQFNKWAQRAPVCLLLDINCDTLGIDGHADQIESHWKDLDVTSVSRLVFRHCSAIEMPQSLRIFQNLKSIKLYNSSLVTWNVPASDPTDSSLRKLRSLQFIRVNFSNAELPQGIRSSELLQGVRVIDFCVTNLRDLPPELDEHWPKSLRLSLEFSALTEILPVVLRLAPWQLSVSGNAIRDAPPALFQSPGIHRIALASTLLSSLPTDFAESSSTLRQVSVAHSPMNATLPPWMNAVVARAQRDPFLTIALYAGGTPFCDQETGGRAITSSRWISCRPQLDEISFPLAFEDSQSGLYG